MIEKSQENRLHLKNRCYFSSIEKLILFFMVQAVGLLLILGGVAHAEHNNFTPYIKFMSSNNQQITVYVPENLQGYIQLTETGTIFNSYSSAITCYCDDANITNISIPTYSNLRYRLSGNNNTYYYLTRIIDTNIPNLATGTNPSINFVKTYQELINTSLFFLGTIGVFLVWFKR